MQNKPSPTQGELELAKVILELRGGLGNQLFQYSAGAFFAKQFGATLVIDDSSIYKHADKTRRSWLKRIDYINTFGFQNVVWMNSSRKFYLGATKRFRPTKVYYDESGLKTIRDLTRDICIYDWFHDKSYVESLHSEFLNEDQSPRKLQLKNRITNENKSPQKSGAAMHMRLGDFKNTSWGTLPSDWYLARVKNLMDLGVQTLDCYSDDLIESKTIIEKWNLGLTFRFPEDRRLSAPHELLYTLSQYPMMISSNSTLSWWASYFNRNQNATILCNWNQKLRLKHWQYYG